jgi:hypothetical protein
VTIRDIQSNPVGAGNSAVTGSRRTAGAAAGHRRLAPPDMPPHRGPQYDRQRVNAGLTIWGNECRTGRAF